MKYNGVQHVCSSPFDPAFNGLLREQYKLSPLSLKPKLFKSKVNNYKILLFLVDNVTESALGFQLSMGDSVLPLFNMLNTQIGLRLTSNILGSSKPSIID